MSKIKNIVLIADRVKDHYGTTLKSSTLEFTEDDYFNALYSSLNEINSNLTYYNSPEDFMDNIKLHRNDVVLSVWSGEKSRNRKALVPSICEAHNIPYVGADSYLQIVSADKHLSKNIGNQYGIQSANDVLLSNPLDCWMLETLKFPIIIKPNFEGGSIGIFSNNVATNIDEAKAVCKSLLENFSPIIAEEYLIGQEVSVCIAGINQSIDVFQIMRQKIGDKVFFTHEILSAEVKKMHNCPRIIEPANHILPAEEKEKLIQLFNSLGKVEVMRIDGRINNNKFYLIELTPDCSLNITGSMSLAFRYSGYTYTNMLRKLIHNTIHLWEYQNANK